MRSALPILAVTIPTLLAPAAGAQSHELPPLLPRAEEIRLARSAAPPEVSGAAAVLVLERGGFVPAATGTNGVTCIVNRSRPQSLEPICYDAEASATILPVHMRRVELRERGLDDAQVQADVDAGLREGRFRLPRRPAMAYMMSAGQVLIADDGRRIGAWKPHVMLFYPYLTAADLGLGGEPSTRAALMFDGGTALTAIVVVVEDFVRPEEFVAAR